MQNNHPSISGLPLVSIVIPCYKHKDFLKRCLDSVAAQTYENLEVVIIDDCSPDGSSEEIARLIQSVSWESRFPNRTQFYPFTKNQGAHAAINYGITQAKGNIIAILNSDDTYHPQRLQLIVKEMQAKGCEFAFSRVQYIDADDRIVTESHPQARSYFAAQETIRQFPSVGFACFTYNVSISTGNFVFTKELFNRVGHFNNYLYCHDWDFLLRSIVHTEPLFLEQDLYYYRFHGKNSFESLGSIGSQETHKILTAFISQIRNSLPPNRLAPSPFNWPDLFELFIHWYGYDKLNTSG
ncbi:glycosyltransferase family 2 protein [Microcoleus vaginatus]|uniref:glycosyltransferase family 2 protein n=1 Tax=Microcoleus vaginatus TaxID=119532 RepID=UPI0032AC0C62